MGKSEKSHVSQKKRGWEKTNMVNFIGKILVTNRDTFHTSKISMSTFIEREHQRLTGQQKSRTATAPPRPVQNILSETIYPEISQ
jgi:hypothetical protein